MTSRGTSDIVILWMGAAFAGINQAGNIRKLASTARTFFAMPLS